MREGWDISRRIVKFLSFEVETANILFDRHDGSVCVDALAKHLGIEVHKMELSTSPVYRNGKKRLVFLKGPAG